ncbi:hypothetical protein LZ023_35265 (plasmid) [Pseudomonas silvicola]|nr:hypothetical protein LZ023_35265 [Pseudomonas silvicola]
MGVDLAEIAVEDRNCIWLAFNHPGWRKAINDLGRRDAADGGDVSSWTDGRTPGDPHTGRVFARLLNSSDEFAQTWQRYELGKVENRLKRFYREEVGEMTLRQNNWWSASRNGDRLLVYVPDDEQSAASLGSD